MIDLRSFSLHIFDLDDTLINTREAYSTAQERAVRLTLPDIDQKSVNKLLPQLKWLSTLFGSGNVIGYMEAFLKSNTQLLPYSQSILDRLVEKYHEAFSDQLRCFEGVHDILAALLKMGSILLLVSNGYATSQRTKLMKTELDGFFPVDRCFISEDFPPELKKPSPHMLTVACRKFGAAAEKAVYYGNTVEDMVAGNLAAVTPIHYSETTILPVDIPPVAEPADTITSWKSAIERFI